MKWFQVSFNILAESEEDAREKLWVALHSHPKKGHIDFESFSSGPGTEAVDQGASWPKAE